MKKIRNAARCTRIKGRECRAEIREPLGSGTVKYRGIEAIRQNPPRRDKGAFESRHSANAEIQPELRALKEQLRNRFSLRLRSEWGQAQRGSGYRTLVYGRTVGLLNRRFFCDFLGPGQTNVARNGPRECSIVTAGSIFEERSCGCGHPDGIQNGRTPGTGWFDSANRCVASRRRGFWDFRRGKLACRV